MQEAPPRPPEPRDEVAALMRRLYRRGLTTTSGGNASIRDGDGRIWITPAALDKGELRPTDVVCVGPDGSLVGGEPSSELTLHREVYRERSDVGAIVHAHPSALVAFSLRHEAPETVVFPPAAEVCGRVGYVAYELTGSDRLGRRVAEAFAKGSDCVILENHGVVAAGCDCREAFVRLETLEWTAAIIVAAASLGTINHPTTRVGLDWAERTRGRASLAGVCGIANGWLRYLPHPDDLAHPKAGEHYEVLMSTFAPGACERLLDAGEALLAELPS